MVMSWFHSNQANLCWNGGESSYLILVWAYYQSSSTLYEWQNNPSKIIDDVTCIFCMTWDLRLENCDIRWIVTYYVEKNYCIYTRCSLHQSSMMSQNMELILNLNFIASYSCYQLKFDDVPYCIILILMIWWWFFSCWRVDVFG